MAQNDQKTRHLEPQLCPECTQMYGSPVFDNMCSKCFKKNKAEQKVQEVKSLERKESQPPLKLTETHIKIEQTPSKKRELPREEELKPVAGRCTKCNKKTGMLGYNCKHCSHQYCKHHRLPEEHDCDTDFISLGRKQIKTDNPTISKKKIEHI